MRGCERGLRLRTVGRVCSKRAGVVFSCGIPAALAPATPTVTYALKVGLVYEDMQELRDLPNRPSFAF